MKNLVPDRCCFKELGNLVQEHGSRGHRCIKMEIDATLGENVARWFSAVALFLGLAVQAQVALERATGVKQLPHLSWAFTCCGNSCRREQPKEYA